MDIPIEIAVAIPATALSAVGIWQWQVRNWIDDYTSEMNNHADNRRQFINGRLEELKTNVGAISKTVEKLDATGEPNLQLWDDLDKLSDLLSDADATRVADTRIRRNLRGLRDWVFALIIGVSVTVGGLVIDYYSFDGNIIGYAVILFISEFLVLGPAIRVLRHYRKFVATKEFLRANKLL